VTLEKGADVPAIPDLPDGAPVVCHGPGFITRALTHPRLRAGLFFNSETFRWSAFRLGWGEAMLASNARAMPLSAARALLADGLTAFVRPDADSKAFNGGVYDAASIERTLASVPVSDDVTVILAPPLVIDAEWRFFIVKKVVVAVSQYRRWGEASTEGPVPHSAIDLAAELASRWSPADVYCLDLAATGSRLGVVEANCFNASRFYAADGDRILRAVNDYALTYAARQATGEG
jgi:hypothetical protein